MNNSKILFDLSDEQKLTFDESIHSKCILASAGSGKTRTLITHIANDIINGILPQNIIAFTFTKKAADDIFQKVLIFCRKHIPEIDLDEINICTIHSWCYDFLKNEEEFINFEAIDKLQESILLRRYHDNLRLKDIYKVNYPVGVFKFIEDLEIFYNENVSHNEIPENIKDAILAYEKILLDNRLLNFGSMIRNATNKLFKIQGVSNLSSLYVDEYQDVNPSQVVLIKSMLNSNTKLTVVGDDLQCIYNWRGSDVNRILNFRNDFPGSRNYILNDNYRSLEQIIEVSNIFSKTIEYRYKDKKMNSIRRSLIDRNVLYISTLDKTSQAKEIVKIIKNLILHGAKYTDVAILLRSVTHSGLEILKELEQNKIPVLSPLVGRADSLVFLLIIPILEWIIDDSEPKNQEEEDELEKRSNELLSNYKKISNDPVDEIQFWQSVNDWKRLYSEDYKSASNIRLCFFSFLRSTNIVIAKDDNSMMVSIGIVSQLIRSVEEIHRRRLKGIEKKSIYDIYKDCIITIKDNYRDEGESYPVDYSVSGVTLTTIHQSKGLEWPFVIIPMMNKNKFPVPSMPHKTSFPDSLSLRYSTRIDDERRLFYVALTRSQDRLFILDTSNSINSQRSLFINNLIDSTHDSLSKPVDNQKKFWTKEFEEDSKKKQPSIRISISDLLIYIECAFQYGLRRKVEIQPIVGDELGFGKGLHEIIQRRLIKRRPLKENELFEMVEAHVALPYQSENEEKVAKKSIIHQINLLEKINLFNYNILPEENIEILTEFGLVEGIVDGIIENEDGTFTVVDWKSNIHDSFKKRYELQIKIYALALQHKGYFIKEAILVDIGASSKSENLVAIIIPITGEVIRETFEIIESATKSIAGSLFTPNQSIHNCSICDVKNICSYQIK